VLLFWSWSWFWSWSCYFGLGLGLVSSGLGLGLGLGLVSSGLGLGLVILILVLRISSVLHHCWKVSYSNHSRHNFLLYCVVWLGAGAWRSGRVLDLR